MAYTYARFSEVMRTIHIYLTMFAFLLMLFFSLTGAVLNHEDWIAGQTTTRDTTGVQRLELMKSPDKLMIVEHLRSDYGAIDAVSTFDDDPTSFHIELKGPGRHTEADIERATGKLKLSVEHRGMLMRLDDRVIGKAIQSRHQVARAHRRGGWWPRVFEWERAPCHRGALCGDV